MVALLKSTFVSLVFSGYFFPVEFSFLAGLNTKMILAVIGLLLLIIEWIKKQEALINPAILIISIFAGIFSLGSLFSVIYNNTHDYVYATYIVKMWTWLSGAFAVLNLIRSVHKRVSFSLIFKYIAWVCVIQSLLALLIDNVPAFQSWVDTYFLQDTAYLHKTKRLYGIGAYFDTAGVRFSCALLGLGYLLSQKSEKTNMLYWVLFLIISIIGNIISRTTTVGVIVALLYVFISKTSINVQLNQNKIRYHISSILIIGVIIGITCYCYYSFPTFRNNLQYGFEGFFNWYNTGEWSTSSTDRLQNMIVLPDNTKTWLIGDGWFVNPYDSNAFYKYTDVGYLRFIFYCGCIGLSLFISFFICCTIILIRKWKEQRLLFILLLLIGLVVWTKISTDVFLVYALLLLIDRQESEENTTISYNFPV